MVHQSITVCRDVRPKPVHSVEQKGSQIFGWSLPAPCHVPQKEKTRWKAKTMPVSRVKRGWRSSFQSMLRLHISIVCPVICHPTTTHNPFNCHPSCPLRETADSLQQAASVYLQSLKPEVPSGPVGWRITWLFGRTGSDGCCAFIRAGLMIWGEIRINYITVFFPTSRYFALSFTTTVFNVLPVLAWIVLRSIIWRSTTQNPSACFCILCLPLGQRLHLLRGTRRGCRVSCGAVIWRTFQNSNLRWGCCRQRVILDYNSSANRWATRTQVGFPVPVNMCERRSYWKKLHSYHALNCFDNFSLCLLCLLIYFQFSLKPSLDFLRRKTYSICTTIQQVQQSASVTCIANMFMRSGFHFHYWYLESRKTCFWKLWHS